MLSLDEAILIEVAKWRSPTLTRVMMDVGSFGSPVVIFLIAAFAFTVLWTTNNRIGAVRVAAAWTAEIWLEILKRVIARPRPAVVPYLVSFSGFSFPSGHAMTAAALYATIAAVISSTYVQDRNARVAIWLICIVIIATVAASRVYLGVHYPTDVVGGLIFGIAWSLLCGRLWPARSLK